MGDKPQNKKIATSAWLTAIIIVSCVAVYLLTESGYGTTREAMAEPVYTPAPVLLLSQSQFLEEALTGRAYRETGEHTFAIRRDDAELAEAELRLSVRERAVCAYTLVAELPPIPEEPGSKATALEEELYLHRKERYAAESAWVCELFTALTRALDSAGKLTGADVDSLWTYAAEAMLTGKRREERIGDHVLRAYLDTGAQLPVLHVSVQDESVKAEPAS